MNTRTKTIDTELIKSSIDLRDYAGAFTTLRRESANELAGPCPKCGGDDRFHAKPDSFFCRQCYPLGNGKPHDAFAFVMWMNGVDFPTAAAMLTNTPLPTAPATKRQPTTKRRPAQVADWQHSAEIIMEQGEGRLFDDADKQADAGRHWLEQVRKLEPHTWQAFKLGFIDAGLPATWNKETKERTYPKQPAIVIPWLKGGAPVALRYRFLEAHTYKDIEGNERVDENKSSMYESDFTASLFGGQALEGNAPEWSTVLIVEGEINAMSIWQASRHTHLDVFSFGSQDSKLTESMINHLKHYACVMCWLDEADRAVKIAEALPGAYAIKSTDKQDANDLLRAGKLGGVLALHRFQAAKDKHEQEHLLWDLRDAARCPQGMDKDTARVVAHLAKLLGKSIPIEEVAPDTWRVMEGAA